MKRGKEGAGGVMADFPPFIIDIMFLLSVARISHELRAIKITGQSVGIRVVQTVSSGGFPRVFMV